MYFTKEFLISKLLDSAKLNFLKLFSFYSFYPTWCKFPGAIAKTLTSSTLSKAWYATWYPWRPEWFLLCHDTRTEKGWMSWIASFKTSGAEQKAWGSRSRKTRPRSSGGCSHLNKPPSTSPTPTPFLPRLRPPPTPLTNFWWSRNHSHNSCDSQPQCKGFSVNETKTKFAICETALISLKSELISDLINWNIHLHIFFIRCYCS